MLQRYLLIWLTLLCAVAYLWPAWIPGGLDPFAASVPYQAHLFFMTMFAIGGLLRRDEIAQVFRRWPTVLGGTAIQYAAMPTLAYAAGRLFGLEGDVFLGVILVGCVPGAMASNVLTLTARGNVSYSVSLTTAATLLSPLVVPAALFLILRQTSLNPVDLARSAFWDLLRLVVIPVLAGHLLSRWFAAVERSMNRWGPIVANLAILWIIAVVVNRNRGQFPRTGADLFVALVLVNIAGYACGYAGGLLFRLPDRSRRALTLEIGMQNAGLGAVLAQRLFADRELVALPPALYTFGCMLTGTILARLWASRVPSDDGEKDAAGTATVDEPAR